MSHSTHVGFNEPLTTFTPCDCKPLRRLAVGVGNACACSFSCRRAIDRLSILMRLAERQSRAVGVAQSFTAELNPHPAFALAPGWLCRPSTVGVGHITAAPRSVGFPRIYVREPLSASAVIGVGNKPEPVSSVRCTNGGSWYAVPLRIKPERGQVSENSLKPPSKECCDVLHDDVAWSKLANKSGVLRPKAAPLALNSRAFSCNTDVLAGEPAADDINGNSVSGKSVGCEASDIFVLPHLWPMLRQHLAAERINLAECNRLKSARPLKAEREAADAAEKVEHPKPAHRTIPMPIQSRRTTGAERAASMMAGIGQAALRPER